MGIFFDGGGGDDLVDMGNKLPGHLFRCGRLILGAFKPAIRDFQKARSDMAMAKAAREMQQKIQSPDSPEQSPASRPSPSVAQADLSPPPMRKKS